MPEVRPGRHAALFGLALAVAAPGLAQTANVPAPEAAPRREDNAPAGLQTRIDQLPAVLAGSVPYEDYFAPSFLAALPSAQIAAFAASLQTAGGSAIDARAVEPVGTTAARFTLLFERATAEVEIAIDGSGRVAQLLVKSLTPTGDSVTKLTQDIAALSGTTAWGIYRIDPTSGEALRLAGAGSERPLAIGSSFKLAVLGALDTEISAGRMSWRDVVTLDRRSIPSGLIQDWPVGAPLTLHSLAALMISQSDNSATDTLMRHIGRERVEAFAREHGGLSGPNAFPVLTTIEASVLKNRAAGAARADWLAGDEAQRRAVLIRHAAEFRPENVDLAGLVAQPADIDRIEWFASPDSLARLLGWFVVSGSHEAQGILAISPGLPAGLVRSLDYAGYKGGSETGVIATNYLVRSRDGAWVVVAMAWNNPAAAVDNGAFGAMAARAVTLSATAPR